MDDTVLSDAKRVTKEHWLVALCSVLSLVALCGGMLVGATVWIANSNRAVADQFMAALNAQSKIIADTQDSNQRRITTLEIEQQETNHINDRLATQVEQLRSAEGDLTNAVQRLSDLLPEKKR